MQAKGKRIGLMGGSFDPIHYGHLVLAEGMRTRLDLDRVIFIPVGKAPHKSSSGMALPRQRFEMVMLATLDHPGFEVSAVEIERQGPSYSFETVKSLVEQGNPEDAYFFIAGADTLMELESWRAIDVLLKLVTFVGAARPGTDQGQLVQKIEHLRAVYDARILIEELPELEISSTDLRERIRIGSSVKYLMPDSVVQYIQKNSLYLPEALPNAFLSD